MSLRASFAALLLLAAIPLAAQVSPAQSKGRLFPPLDLGLLDAPDREQWTRPDLIMDALGIADGAVVADFGAGGGWFTTWLARRVGPNGLVYAQDIQPLMIEAITSRVQNEGLTNVRTIIGTPNDPRLPSRLDAILIVGAYYEMNDPARPEFIVTLLRSLAASLKPVGRLGIVDYLPGGGGPGPDASERVNPDDVIRAAEAVGLKLQSRQDIPPFQFLLVFGKTAAATADLTAPATAGLRLRSGPERQSRREPDAVTDRPPETATSLREPRTVLTIAGSDSGGGAGIQADLKTFAAFGCYGASAITAVTAQNTVAVVAAEPLATELVILQIETVAADITIHATKTGMLATAAIVEAVAAAVAGLELPNLVVDPVMVAKSGDALLDRDAVRAICNELVPRARVVTPNIPEAEAMTGLRIRTLDDVRAAAAQIRKMGPTAVVIKGGHAAGDDIVDLLMTADEIRELHVPRVHTRNTHGTGCTFASAIAALLAQGHTVPDAVVGAQAYVAGAIRHALAVGHGHGPLDHFWRTRSS